MKGYRSQSVLSSLLSRNIVKRSKIIRIKDPRTDSTEYHAIVQVDSPTNADHIIEKLDGRTVNGLHIRPHRYYRRFSSRDRRSHQVARLSRQERRTGDRRRRSLITQVMEIS